RIFCLVVGFGLVETVTEIRESDAHVEIALVQRLHKAANAVAHAVDLLLHAARNVENEHDIDLGDSLFRRCGFGRSSKVIGRLDENGTDQSADGAEQGKENRLWQM